MRLIGLAGLFACCAFGAWAAEISPAPIAAPAPAEGWIVSLGVSGQIGPKFDGASSAGFSGMPSLSWRRIGEAEGFSAPDDGLDYALYETDRFSVGVVGNFRSGRYSGSDNRLFGLRDIPWTVEAGVFAEYWPILERLRTRIELRQGFHGHHGLVADVSVDWVERFGAFTFALGPRLALGDGRFMRRNFGVTAQEAALNGYLAAYRPEGGLKSVGVATSLDYKWSESWTTTLFGRYDRLTADAARSSIVRTIGQRDQLSAGLGVTYSFAVAK